METKTEDFYLMHKVVIISFCLCLFLVSLLGSLLIETPFEFKETVLFSIYFAIFYLWHFYYKYPNLLFLKFEKSDYILIFTSIIFMIINVSNQSVFSILISIVIVFTIFLLCMLLSSITFPKFAKRESVIPYMLVLNFVIISLASLWGRFGLNF
jgi:hypothetical protein